MAEIKRMRNIIMLITSARVKIEELRKGPKGPQCNSDFISKIEGRSNTAFFQPNRLDQSELGEYPPMNN